MTLVEMRDHMEEQSIKLIEKAQAAPDERLQNALGARALEFANYAVALTAIVGDNKYSEQTK
jgi:hypothetical protein